MSVEAPEGTHPVDAGARTDTTSAPATVSAVIPALNEARNLPEALGFLEERFQHHLNEMETN